MNTLESLPVSTPALSTAPVVKLSCPFCGAHDDELVMMELDTAAHAVTCNCCGAVGPQDTDSEHAKALWNGAALHALNVARRAWPEEVLRC